MIQRRIEELYGFGAARIALRGEAFHVGDPDHALRRAAAIFARDMRAEGLRRTLTYSAAPLLGIALILLLSLATLLVRPDMESSDIELVAFEIPQLIPPPVPLLEEIAEPLPEPVPLPPVAKLEPPPPPPPVPVAKPAAPLAPPVVLPEPLMAVAKPIVPQVRPKPTPRSEPAPLARPRVQIDSVARAPEPAPLPEPQTQRLARAEPVQQRARVEVAPMSATALPELSVEPAPSRERFRLASATPAASAARPAVRLDPMPARIADAPTDLPADRAARPAPRVSAPVVDRARPRPDLAPARSQAIAPRNDAAPQVRAARSAPEPVATRSRPAADVRLPQLNAPTPTSAGASATDLRRIARVEPVLAPPSGDSRSDQEAKLSGVPLGSLAACLSDRDEDALKQQVVSAVTTQKECLSGAGRYRFLQTKNLNSFLMWVDRAQGRAEADRCAELRYALDCLKRQKRTGS